MKVVDFLFLPVKVGSSSHKLLFKDLLSLENLNICVKLISDVFEECIEVFLQELMLISYDITPFN